MQKARRHPALRHRAPTACKRVVSGSLSSPGRGSSHLSLALLIAIGRQRVLSLAGWTPPLQTAFHVHGLTQVPDISFRLPPTGLSPSLAAHSRAFG